MSHTENNSLCQHEVDKLIVQPLFFERIIEEISKELKIGKYPTLVNQLIEAKNPVAIDLEEKGYIKKT